MVLIDLADSLPTISFIPQRLCVVVWSNLKAPGGGTPPPAGRLTMSSTRQQEHDFFCLGGLVFSPSAQRHRHHDSGGRQHIKRCYLSWDHWPLYYYPSSKRMMWPLWLFVAARAFLLFFFYYSRVGRTVVLITGTSWSRSWFYDTKNESSYC